MNCEMCGKKTDLFKAIIEGIQIKVCSTCGKFGRVIKQVNPLENKKKEKVEKISKEEESSEIIQTISDNYSEKVKKARELIGLKQEELAKKLSEKESVIHKIETGHYEPNLILAKKLERFLKISLIEEQEIEKSKNNTAPSSSAGLTIGDLIKLKK